MIDQWERIDEILGKLEQILLGILLGTMIFIAFIQIALRNALSTGLAWGDGLVRNLVLWTGFIGAAVATREGKHISIDAVSRMVITEEKDRHRDHHQRFFAVGLCLPDLCGAEIRGK